MFKNKNRSYIENSYKSLSQLLNTQVLIKMILCWKKCTSLWINKSLWINQKKKSELNKSNELSELSELNESKKKSNYPN